MKFKKSMKIIGVVLCAGAVLIIAAAITFNIAFPPEKIKAIVLSQVEKAVGRSVTIKRIGISVFPVGVKVTGVTIANTERHGFSKEPFVTCDAILVKVKVLPLFQKKLTISAVVLKRPSVLIEVDRNGALNYDDLFFVARGKKSRTGRKVKIPLALPIPLSLENCIVKRGKVIYHDRRSGRKVTVGDINQRVYLSIDKALKNIQTTGELKISGITIESDKPQFSFIGETFVCTHDIIINAFDGEALINSIEISSQNIDASIIGNVKSLNAEPVIDLTLQATIHCDDRENPIKLSGGNGIAGTAKVRLKVNGLFDTADPAGLNVDGNIALTDLQLTTPELAKPVMLNGTIDFTSKQIAGDLKIGIGSSDIACKAKISDYLTMVVSDSTKKLPRPGINVSIISSLLNINEFLIKDKKKTMQTRKKEKVSGFTPASGSPKVILAAPFSGVDVKGDISCNEIIYESVRISSFNSRIDAVNDVMNVSTRANISGGSLSNKLNLDAGNLKNVRITNTFNCNNVKVNELLSVASDLLPDDQPLYKELKKLDNGVFGRLTLHTDFRCHGATPDDMTRTLYGKMDARIDKGRIKKNVFTRGVNKRITRFSKKVHLPLNKVVTFGDITFRKLLFMASVKEEQVFIETFTVNSPKSGDYDVTGTVGFNGALDVAISDRFPQNVSKEILSVQKTMKKPLKKGVKQAEKELSKKLGKALARILGKAAAKEIDKSLIQPDKDGRVTMYITYRGTVQNPKLKKFGFKKPKGSRKGHAKKMTGKKSHTGEGEKESGTQRSKDGDNKKKKALRDLQKRAKRELEKLFK